MKLRTNQRGATILEFGLVIGVVILFVVSIIDISLYFHAKSTLKETASRIAKTAVVDSDFSLDSRSFPGGASLNPAVSTKVSDARTRIINQAIEFASQGLMSPNFSSDGVDGIKTEFNYSDNGFLAPGSANTQNAILLRPGEQVRRVKLKDGTAFVDEVIPHPNCAPNDPNAALCTQKLATRGSDAWNFMQRNYPYYVEIQAQVRTLLLGNIDIKSQAVAWKDISDTDSPDDFADVPTPRTCAEEYPDPDQYCIEQCGSLDACTFHPDNTVPSCHSCKQCQEFTSAAEVCQECGEEGNEYQSCTFNSEAGEGQDCGGCNFRTGKCSDFSEAEEIVCSACDGDGNDDPNLVCEFDENGNVTAGGTYASCGGCKVREVACSELESVGPREEHCDGCADGEDPGLECDYNDGTVPIDSPGQCGQGCIERTGRCVDFFSDDDRNEACANGCPDGQECQLKDILVAYNERGECGGCGYGLCSTLFDYPDGVIPPDQAVSAENCPCDLETEVCEFIANQSPNVPTECFRCKRKTCEQLYPDGNVDELCDAFYENPANADKECIFDKNKPGCIRTPGKSCDTLIEERGEDTVKAQQCGSCGESEVCLSAEQLGGVGFCFGCGFERCSERFANEQEACEAVDCFGKPTMNCENYNGDSRSLECVQCKPKACEQLVVDGVIEHPCGEDGDSCGVGFTCAFEPGDTSGNCKGCQQCNIQCDASKGFEIDPETGCSCRACNPSCQEGEIQDGCECIPQSAA